MLGVSGWILGKFLLQKSDWVLEWAAQGGGGVTDSGGVQGIFKHCVEGQLLVRGRRLDWMIL